MTIVIGLIKLIILIKKKGKKEANSHLRERNLWNLTIVILSKEN